MGLGCLQGDPCYFKGCTLRSYRFRLKSLGIIAFVSFAALNSFVRTSYFSEEAVIPGRSAYHNTALPQNYSLQRIARSRDILQITDLNDPKDAGAAHESEHENCVDCEEAARQRRCAAVFQAALTDRCKLAKANCHDSSKSLIDYTELHFCALKSRPWISVPLLTLLVIGTFYLLAETAEEYFCPVVARISNIMSLGPSTAGVTFLAFGNGAPDVFSSLAAFVGGNPKIGIGAIISAGAFVTAFVVGCVALAAAPFNVRGGALVRDILFYTVAAVGVFATYLSGIVYLWQAIWFVLYYAVFVTVVFISDRLRITHRGSHVELRHLASPIPSAYEGRGGGVSGSSFPSRLKSAREEDLDGKEREQMSPLLSPGDMRRQKHPLADSWSDHSPKLSWMSKLLYLLQKPFEIARKASIPSVDDLTWSHKYAVTNVIVCPLVLLYMCSGILPATTRIQFFHPSLYAPVWSLVLLQSSIFGLSFHLANPSGKPPETGRELVVFLSFIMSIFWISMLASELLGLLSSLGLILGVSPAIIGVTVLAWGNSVGDLVADVTVARAGQPTMAIAGCFAGPMFNMLVGLGLALTIKTASIYPAGLPLHYHPNIPVAFLFLFSSLLGSLFVISSSGFQVRRWWGISLILLYVCFTVVSIVIESGAIVNVPV